MPSNKKYNSEYCDDKMKFEDCEMAILRHAVDETTDIQKGKIANSKDVADMIKIVEDFLLRKKLVCYGGTAINNILPKYAQFYNRDLEIPDYDFFSDNAIEDARELTDIFFKAGYLETEAKSGVHKGTYKVYVNYIPMADITQLHPILFDSLKKEAITVAGIKYAPPNYLRMSMYLELSRPAGDVSRWEKVMKRLTLLNRFYPLKHKSCKPTDIKLKKEEKTLYYVVRESFIEQGVIFFGGFAHSLYSKFNKNVKYVESEKTPDFDIICEDHERCAIIVKEKLMDKGFSEKTIQIVEHENIDDVIPRHSQIVVGKTTVARIFEPIACHSYNIVKIGHKEMNIATIDTILSFYLAFIYVKKPYFNKERMLCIAQNLFYILQKNRLAQDGILKRFTISCYGKQPTLESMRAEKTQKFKELTKHRDSKEWNEWFFKYAPGAKLSKDVLSKGKVGDEEEEDCEQSSPKQLSVKIQKRKTQKKKKKKRKTNTLKNVLPFLYK